MSMSRIRTMASTALITVLAVVGVASPSSAATAQWSSTLMTSSPALYYTNQWYGTTEIKPSEVLPPAAVTTTIDYTWKMMDPPPSGQKYTVYLCRNAGADCANVSASYSTATYTGSTSYFSGKNIAAGTPLQFYVRIADGGTTQEVLNPAKFSSSYRVAVNYAY